MIAAPNQDPEEVPVPLLQVGLHRLPVDKRIDLTVAVTVIVQLAAAPVIEVEVVVGVGPAPPTALKPTV